MPYLRESEVRKAARTDRRVIAKSMNSSEVLRESVSALSPTEEFDIFLCHSIRDAELIQGAKKLLEDRGFAVYVDWIVDPQMNRSAVTAETARTLRLRMQHSRSLLYIFSNSSKRSRWMPWELGYFDGQNGTVGVLPIAPDLGTLDFNQEEYLGLYPKVELENTHLFVNRTTGAPVGATDKAHYREFTEWITGTNKLRL